MRHTVHAVLATADPENCAAGTNTANVTEHYLGIAYGDTKGCIRAQVRGAVADSFRSYMAKTSGDRAKVTVRPSGGVYDGERITVSLVREDGRWKVDSLKSNAPVGP